MDYPVIFPLRERLTHRSADDVRRIVQNHGFRMHNAPRSSVLRNDRMRGFSEIWYKLCGRGYAVVRVDSQGHANLRDREGNQCAIGGIGPGPHGSGPHYHKEWIAAEWFPQYLATYVPAVVRYNDAGDPVTGQMTDGKAKRTHIRQ